MGQPIGTGAVTGAHVRAAMLGATVSGIQVARQAWRVTPGDSDEIAVLQVGTSWWLAQRVSDELTVWVFAGDDEAWDAFDRRLRADDAAGHGWHESRPAATPEPLTG